MRTPVSREGLNQFDHLPPEEAIIRAWTEAGRSPYWHGIAKVEVDKAMPVLARAINRLVKENKK